MVDQKLVISVIKGILTYIPGLGVFLDKKKGKSRHSGSDASFAYSLWFSMLVLFNEKKIDVNYSKIGEVGNGGSLGVAFCALLTGVKEYCSFEIRTYIDFTEQKKLLNDVYQLLKEKTPITRYANLNISIENANLPYNFIKTTPLEQEKIYNELLSDLNNQLINSKYIKLIPDWENQGSLNLTFIFSRAVMEHVNNPAHAYSAIANHLKSGGYMLHDIEFHSHGLTKTLTGHYEIQEFLWKIISGKRQFFLNRFKLNDHNTAVQAAGFYIDISIPNFKIQNEKKEMIGGVILARKEHE